MEFIFIYIPMSSKEEAKKIVFHLLEKKFIACANIFPIESFYWWEGKITEDNEIVAIVKTVAENYEKVKREVETLHSYSVPCITKLTASANEKYFQWLKDAVN